MCGFAWIGSHAFNRRLVVLGMLMHIHKVTECVILENHHVVSRFELTLHFGVFSKD